MAMIESPLQDTGLLITPYMAAYINLYDDRNNLSQNVKEIVDAKKFDAAADDTDHEANFVLHVEGYLDTTIAGEILESLGFETVWANEFTGEADSIHDPDLHVDFDAEYIVYIPTEKGRSVFNNGYNTLDEIAAEFQNKLQHILPANFDYKSAIMDISGTTLS